jgi:hypothetical protein
LIPPPTRRFILDVSHDSLADASMAASGDEALPH